MSTMKYPYGSLSSIVAVIFTSFEAGAAHDAASAVFFWSLCAACALTLARDVIEMWQCLQGFFVRAGVVKENK